MGPGAHGAHALPRQEIVEREPLGLDPPDLLGGQVVDRQLEVLVDPLLRRKPAIGLVVDDLVAPAGDAVHPVDDAGQGHALDLDREPVLERGRDPVGGRVLSVVLPQHLPAVVAIRPFLRCVAQPLADPDGLQHLVEVLERGRDGNRAAVEQVQRAVERVAERERGRGRRGQPVLVLELELGGARLERVDAGVGESHRASVRSTDDESQGCSFSPRIPQRGRDGPRGASGRGGPEDLVGVPRSGRSTAEFASVL